MWAARHARFVSIQARYKNIQSKNNEIPGELLRKNRYLHGNTMIFSHVKRSPLLWLPNKWCPSAKAKGKWFGISLMLILYIEHYIGNRKNVSRLSAANHVKPHNLDVKMMYFELGQSRSCPNNFEYYKILSVSNFRDPSLDVVFYPEKSG